MTQQVVSVDPQLRSPAMVRDDEIDLAELFAKVWGRKWWVVAATTLAVLVAGLYLLAAKPVYKAEVYLMPPTATDVGLLNVTMVQVGVGVLLENTVTPEQAYDSYLNRLRSRQLQLAYFRENGLVDVYGSGEAAGEREVFEAFQEKLAVQQPKRGEVVYASLALEGPSSPQVAEVANDYVRQAGAVVAAQLVEELTDKRDRKLQALQKEIASKREFAEQRRLDRIKQLEEALVIAEAVGLSRPGDTAGRGRAEQNINILNTDTLFMRGADALRAEIAALKARISDDPFIEGLRNLQEAIGKLKAISVQPGQVEPVRIDLEAVPPQKPIKPKKKLVLAAALVLGGMLGLFIALVVPSRRQSD